MLTISLEGMRFYAYHGYYPEERLCGAWYGLSVQIVLKGKGTEEGEDRLDGTFNYEEIYRICADEMGTARKLIETAARRILDRLRKSDREIASIRVRIDKEHPPLRGEVDKAVVEVWEEYP